MKCRKSVTIFLVSAVLLGMGTTTVLANSAQSSWEGVDATGAIVADESCPLVVQDELLTFDISGFPQTHYRQKEEYLSYPGRVTAQYTFYNPADYTVTAKLLFPFGAVPSYAFTAYDEALERYTSVDDTAQFDILADGQAVEKTLRHTFFVRYDQFELDEELALLQDGFAEDAFYSPDLPVTRYTYTISGIDEKASPAANAALDIPEFDGTRKVLLADQSGCHTQKNGDSRISTWAENGQSVTLYVIGVPFSQQAEWKFYQNGGVENGGEIEGSMTLKESTELTFKELALSEYNAEGGVSEWDWYNAVVAALNGSTWENAGFVSLMDLGGLDLSGALMRWYEYELTLAPGQRLVNTVEAPVYPSIDTGYDPAVYGYTYLLSPAQTWASFGKIDVVINTPYFITESSLEGFVKTEAGYSLALDGLPEGELLFTLSQSETPRAPRGSSVPNTVAGAALAGILLLGGGIAFAAVRRRNG